MKKIWFIAGAVMLLAAACNSSSYTKVTPDDTKTTSQTKVDAVVSGLNADVDSEQSVGLQSDDDVVNSDATIINDYQGAINENQY